jgi:hypothetical protein
LNFETLVIETSGPTGQFRFLVESFFPEIG